MPINVKSRNVNDERVQDVSVFILNLKNDDDDDMPKRRNARKSRTNSTRNQAKRNTNNTKSNILSGNFENKHSSN